MGLEMNGSRRSEHANADARPAFVLEDVEGADFGRIKAGTCGSSDIRVERREGFQCVAEQACAGYGDWRSSEKKEI